MYYALTINSDQIITGVHESMSQLTTAAFSENPELADDTVILLENEGEFFTGDHILCYTEDGTRKPVVWCIENGYMEMPPNMEIVNGELVNIDASAGNQPQTLKDYFQQWFSAIKDESDSKFTSMKPLINELLIDKPAAVVLPLISMMDEWREGKWTAGKSLTHQGHPYKVAQTHDSTGNPTWTPASTPALFTPWHGVSVETALPWRAPTGAHDMYKENEYMVFTDGATYRCLQGTAYSPTDYAQAWEMVNE